MSVMECALPVNMETFNSEPHNNYTNAQEIIHCKEKLSLNFFKRTHRGFPLTKVRPLLIDTDVLWLIMETKLSFPWFDRNGFPSPQLFSALLLLFWCLGLHLKMLPAPCLSPVLLLAFAVCKCTLC